MARTINRLSAQAVARAATPGAYLDGQGLYLRVGKTGTKSWLFCFMMRSVTATGKPKSYEMGLGSADLFSLKEAREKAQEARKKVHAGINPIEERNAARDASRVAAARAISFKEAAERCIKEKAPDWKSDKHAAQWTATLSTYAFPLIGKLPVDKIDDGHVMQVLEPIWREKTETAKRLRGRMEAVFEWAAARKLRKGENPARYEGHLATLLPKASKISKVKHREALPWTDMPDFMTRLRKNKSVSARALEFTILTAARTSEVTGAFEGEIDKANGVWIVPAERMKGGKEHRVPLSGRAMEILAEVAREKDNPYLFMGAKMGRGLSNMAMLELLKGMVSGGMTVHGFRSTFRDWAGDSTNVAREVIEAALAHSLKGVESAYRRGDALDKRRKLMEAWAEYCAQPNLVVGGNVHAIRAAS